MALRDHKLTKRLGPAPPRIISIRDGVKPDEEGYRCSAQAHALQGSVA